MVNLMCSIPIKYIWPCLIIGVIKFSVIQRMFKEYYVIYIILTLGSDPDFFMDPTDKKYMDLGPFSLLWTNKISGRSDIWTGYPPVLYKVTLI